MNRTWVICVAGLFTLLTADAAVAADEAPTGAGQTTLAERIDAANQPLASRTGPGAIVAVLQQGELKYLKGYGLANREFGVPWDAHVRYTFFSVTKPMVAAVFLRLEKEGRLSLDDDVRTYLPDLPKFETPVRIRHLLTHTSGIWEDEVLMHLVGTSVSYAPVSLEELYALTKRQSVLANKPGSYFYYNDTGMRLAALVLQKVTSKPFRDVMREELFEPAGMEDADIKPWEPMFFPREAPTYLVDQTLGGDFAETAIRIGTIVPETSGDGGAVGSILDLVQFARLLSQRPEGAATSLLDELVQPVYYRPGVYGAYRTCFAATTHRGHVVYFHFGFYGKGILYLPHLDLWILFMRNAMDSRESVPRDYVVGLLDAVLGLSTEQSDSTAADGSFMRPPAETFTSEEYGTLVGRFLEPLSGYVIDIDHVPGGLTYRLLGKGGFLVRDPAHPGGLRTYVGHAGPIVQIVDEPNGFALLHADWDAPRPLRRIAKESVPLAAQDMRAYVGLYRSPDYGVVYTVRTAGDRLELGIGSGVRTSDWMGLEHVASDLFESRPSSQGAIFALGGIVRFNRVRGKISSLTINTDDVRGLVLQRLPERGQ